MAYWLISTREGLPGIDGGIMERWHPFRATINTIRRNFCRRIYGKNWREWGRAISPKKAAPDAGWMALLLGCGGNIFGIMQEKKEAR